MEAKRELRRAAKSQARDQRRLRRNGVGAQTAAAADDDDSEAEKAASSTKPAGVKLETINEEENMDEITAEIDKSFEFLDSAEHSAAGVGSNDDSLSSSTPSIFTGKLYIYQFILF